MPSRATFFSVCSMRSRASRSMIARTAARWRISSEAPSRPGRIASVVVLHALVQLVLPRVAEGRVAEIVRQREHLGEVLVERQRAGERPRDLRGLHAVREPRAVVVALVVHEDLRLVLEAAERGGMDD